MLIAQLRRDFGRFAELRPHHKYDRQYGKANPIRVETEFLRFARGLWRSLARQLNAAALAALTITALPLIARSAPQRLTLDHGAQDPAVSPDGSLIAISIVGKLWLIPKAGGDAHQITTGIGWDRYPAWSPDGRFLAYSHHIASGTDLVVLDMATHNASFLHHTDALIGPIEYGPRGSEIFFVLRQGQYTAHIQKTTPAGGEPQRITETDNWHEWTFALSPDGKDLVTASGHYGASNLYRIRLDERKATRLTRTDANQTSVAWTRDGRDFIYVECLNGEEKIFAQPAAGGERRMIYSSPYRDTQLALEPNGETAILCAARRLSRLNLKTGAAVPIEFHAQLEIPEQNPADLTIVHARLIDGISDAPIQNATIDIRKGRFSHVRSSAESVQPGTPVIDAAGKTVLPGLMDNHYHYWDPFDGSNLFARGITSIRDPGVDLSESLNYKEAISSGVLPGPNIYTAGPLIDGIGGYHPMVTVEIDDPAKAAVLVGSLKEQGVDLLKVYFMLKPEVLCSVVREAHKQGLKVTGHIGVRTNWSRAIDCGIDGVNHIRVWADVLPVSEQPQGENSSLDAQIHSIARMQADWSHIDPNGPEIGGLIAKMAKAQVGFDPTLSIQGVDNSARKLLNLEEFALAQDAYARMGTFVARAQESHVPLLAGTDNGSLFDELEAYEHVGVPRMAIIQAATSAGARWLRKENDFGAVAPGRRANLIIVDGDPLAQIKDLRNIRTVIKDGRVVFEK